MNTKTKRRLSGTLAALLVGFVALNALAYLHARAMMSLTAGGSRTLKPEKLSWAERAKVLCLGVTVPRPVSTRSPEELAPDCQRLPIQRPFDCVRLGAWYVDRGPKTPLVVLFHGYGAEKTSLIPQAKVFLKLGASVLLVDFRGSGESSEAYTTIGFREADDVAAVVEYTHAVLPHSAVILYGQSMGAVAILRAVSANGVKPEAVILEAVFDTMLNTVRHRFEAMGVPSFPSAELLVFWGGVQAGFNAFAHEPVVYAKSVTCPALFMHGTDDPRARLEEGLRVYAAVTGAKQFKQFAAVGHESYALRYPAEWEVTVDSFLLTYGLEPHGQANLTGQAGGAEGRDDGAQDVHGIVRP